MSISEFQDIPLDSGRAKTEQPNQPVLVVLDYVEKWIPFFIKESKKKKIQNEKGLTQRLVRILATNLNDTYPFTFDKEGMEDETTGKSSAVDIDVLTKEIISVSTKIFNKGERYFAFEAKLLGNTESRREKEYIIGHLNSEGKYITCGGIERFKKSIHGNGLDQCGMIGYMLNKNFELWYQQINTWIDEFIKSNPDSSINWSNEDKLSSQSGSLLMARYISTNSRMKSGYIINPIKLYHLWINLA